VGWVAVEVVAFQGVVGEVVELEGSGGGVPVDELVGGGADAAVGHYVFEAGVLVVVVKPLFAPLGVSCAGQGHHACALHGGGGVYAGEIEDRGGDVYVEDHLVADDAGVDAFRVADHHGDADGGLVHEALVEETPFAEEVTVVGAVDDGGVVHLVGGFEVGEDAAHVFVDGDYAGVVVLAELFEGADGVLGVDGADLVVGVNEGFGFAGVALEVVVEGGRLGDGDAVVEIEMAAGTEEGCVRGLIPEAETEGLVAAVFF